MHRWSKDAKSVERELEGPVLLYEPPRRAEDTDRRLVTVSTTGDPRVVAGEPVVLVLKKSKDNAFRRGITVGRTSNNDVVLAHTSVSRFHAYFQMGDAPDEWKVADAGSKNGTKLAGQRLTPRKPVPIEPGQRIRFGSVEVQFLTPKALTKLLRAKANR